MLRGEIPPQVFNHRRALLSLGPVLAERSFRRALSLPGTFIARHLLCHSLWRGLALYPKQH